MGKVVKRITKPYRQVVAQTLFKKGSRNGTSLPMIVRLVEEEFPKTHINLRALKMAVKTAFANGKLTMHKTRSRSYLLAPSERKQLRNQAEKRKRSDAAAATKKRRVSTKKSTATKKKKTTATKKKTTATKKKTTATKKKTTATKKKTTATKKKTTATKKKTTATKKKTTATKKTTPAKRASASSPLTRIDSMNASVAMNTTCPIDEAVLNPATGLKVLRERGNKFFDCMLVLRQVSTNTDKYYIMQIHELDGEYTVYRRWGRTGSKGQTKSESFDNAQDAKAQFNDIFKYRTGYAFNFQARGNPPAQKSNKYKILRKTYQSREEIREAEGGAPIWQYWVDDGVDGKRTGWYDYMDTASMVVEGVYSEWLCNNSMSVRCVESGMWSYHVDFNDMTQTNVKHSNHTKRKIRRHIRTE